MDYFPFFFAGDFFAADFLAAGFLAAVFFFAAVFFAAGFFAAGFFFFGAASTSFFFALTRLRFGLACPAFSAIGLISSPIAALSITTTSDQRMLYVETSEYGSTSTFGIL